MAKKRMLAVLSSSAAVAVLGVAGCGAPVNASNTMKAVSLTTGAAAGAHVGGSITINASPHGPWADVFNPYVPGENQDDIVPDIYEPLVEWNGSNGTNLPWLAQSWSWNKSNTVLTVNLRHGVKWSNGKAFTSQDVVFTYDMLHQYPAADSNALWAYMKSISADGPDTVKVTLNKPNATFFYYFSETLMVPKSQFSGKNPVTFKDSSPVGTGPYTLQNFNPQQITLTRNDDYWQLGKPYLKTVYYPAETSNESTILGLATGQIDWATIFSPNLNTSFVAKNKANYHVNTVSGGFDSLYMNLHSYPLNLPVVRQAISMAINRQALSTIGESGYSNPSALNGVGDSMATNWSTPAIQKKDSATFSPAGAKKMLLAAGFKMSNGNLVTPQGKPFTIEMDVPAPWSDFVTMSSQIKSMLGTIGIQVTENSVSANEYLTELETGNFQMGLCWTPSGPNPYFTQNGLMNTNFGGPMGKPAIGMNYGRYSNPEVQKLSNEFNATQIPSKQKAIIAQLGQILSTQLPVINLLNRNTPVEYSSANITGWPTGSNPYWNNSSDSGPVVVLTHLHTK
jgi:peptide/nickel transport system substrate-binding protein